MEETHVSKTGNNTQQIAGAIIVAGILIAGAVLLRGNTSPTTAPDNTGAQAATISKVTDSDHSLGNQKAKLTLVMYEDYQCPFCEKFFTESETPIRETYVQNGDVRLVYRDFAFLGPESMRAAEAARCAADQGKFWEYHDYLFNHQNGENKGTFADGSLKVFASSIGLDAGAFSGCFDNGKYTQAVIDAKTEGGQSGVSGTPKGFILKGGKVVATIDGAEPYTSVKQKIDAALK